MSFIENPNTGNYKLDEIIKDTWPNLYRPPKDWKPPSEVDRKKKT